MQEKVSLKAAQNIFNDAQTITQQNLQLEQAYNNNVQSGIIQNNIGSGTILESTTQNVLWNSNSTSTVFRVGISPTSQPSDNVYGNQLEISLNNTLVGGNRVIKIAIFGYDLNQTLIVEYFYFRFNEIQISKSHFVSIKTIIVDNWENVSNLTGQILIKEAKPLYLSKDSLTISQNLEPSSFWRDFPNYTSVLNAALPGYDWSSLFGITPQDFTISSGDTITKIGEKFLASTSNIEKIRLLLRSDSTVNYGQITLSIYPLQQTITNPLNIKPSLAIGYDPNIIPVAEVTITPSLEASYKPIDFYLSNISLTIGQYYIFTVKSTTTNSNKLYIAGSSSQKWLDSSNYRQATFSQYGSSGVWTDNTSADLWFEIYSDSLKITDGIYYVNGVGTSIDKSIQTQTNGVITNSDYCYDGIDSTYLQSGVSCSVVATTSETKSIQTTDSRTGQKIYTATTNSPNIQVVNTSSVATNDFVIANVQDYNSAFNFTLTNSGNNNIIVPYNNDLYIVNPSPDISSYGGVIGSSLILTINGSSHTYSVDNLEILYSTLGDLNKDGIVDESDVTLMSNLQVAMTTNNTWATAGIITVPVLTDIDIISVICADVGYYKTIESSNNNYAYIENFVNGTTGTGNVGSKISIIKLTLSDPAIDNRDDNGPNPPGTAGDLKSRHNPVVIANSFSGTMTGASLALSSKNQALTSSTTLNVWNDNYIIVSNFDKYAPTIFNSNNIEETIVYNSTSYTKSDLVNLANSSYLKTDVYIPNNVIISGQILDTDGDFFKVDFETADITLYVGGSSTNSNNNTVNINVFNIFVADAGNGITANNYRALKFSDGTYVQPDALNNDQVRFTVAIESYVPNISAYTNDTNLGLSLDNSTGNLSVTFTNLNNSVSIADALISKLHITVYLKKAGFNNTPLTLSVEQTANLFQAYGMNITSNAGGGGATFGGDLLAITSVTQNVVAISGNPASQHIVNVNSPHLQLQNTVGSKIDYVDGVINTLNTINQVLLNNNTDLYVSVPVLTGAPINFGGQNIKLTTDVSDTNVYQGGDLDITAGNAIESLTNTLNTVFGGNININSGSAYVSNIWDYSNVNYSSNSGNVNIQSGNSNISTGSVTISSGNIQPDTTDTYLPIAYNQTGTVVIETGTGDETGSMFISTGQASEVPVIANFSNSGSISISTGMASVATGDIGITTGSTYGNNISEAGSGQININTGSTSSGPSGTIQIVTGVSNDPVNSTGNIKLATGVAYNSESGTSGYVNINSGVGTTSSGIVSLFTGYANTSSGSVEIYTGITSNGSSGSIDINTGSSTNSNSGTIYLHTGIANNSNFVGDVLIYTSNAGIANSNSGSVQISTGSAGNAIGSGNVEITTGQGELGSSGHIYMATGAGDTLGSGPITIMTGIGDGGNSGFINIGTGAGVNGNSGNVNIFTGQGYFPKVNGSINIYTGAPFDNGTSTYPPLYNDNGIVLSCAYNPNGNGGNIDLYSGGSTSFSNTGVTGNINILTPNFGSATTGNSQGSSGNINIISGNAGIATGTSGVVTIQSGAGFNGTNGNVTSVVSGTVTFTATFTEYVGYNVNGLTLNISYASNALNIGQFIISSSFWTGNLVTITYTNTNAVLDSTGTIICNIIANANGGGINIQTADSIYGDAGINIVCGVTNNGNAGNINIIAGTASYYNGGKITIQSGASGPDNTYGTPGGGDIDISTGYYSGTYAGYNGGNINIYTGKPTTDYYNLSGAGGNISIVSGDGIDYSQSGSIVLASGSANFGSGNVYITSGSSLEEDSGDVYISTGNATNENSGAIFIEGGDAPYATGASVEISGGTSSNPGSPGGALYFYGGGSGNQTFGGQVYISAGYGGTGGPTIISGGSGTSVYPWVNGNIGGSDGAITSVSSGNCTFYSSSLSTDLFNNNSTLYAGLVINITSGNSNNIGYFIIKTILSNNSFIFTNINGVLNLTANLSWQICESGGGIIGIFGGQTNPDTVNHSMNGGDTQIFGGSGPGLNNNLATYYGNGGNVYVSGGSTASTTYGAGGNVIISGGNTSSPNSSPGGNVQILGGYGSSTGGLIGNVQIGYNTNISISNTNATLSYSSPTVTLTSSGATFTTSLIGQYITITNAINSNNNGIFIITGVPSATTLTYTNASGVTQSSPSTVNYSITATSIITTTFSQNKLINTVGLNENVHYTTVSYTIQQTDRIIVCNNSGAITITLPSLYNVGDKYKIKAENNSVTTNSTLIDGTTQAYSIASGTTVEFTYVDNGLGWMSDVGSGGGGGGSYPLSSGSFTVVSSTTIPASNNLSTMGTEDWFNLGINANYQLYTDNSSVQYASSKIVGGGIQRSFQMIGAQWNGSSYTNPMQAITSLNSHTNSWNIATNAGDDSQYPGGQSSQLACGVKITNGSSGTTNIGYRFVVPCDSYKSRTLKIMGQGVSNYVDGAVVTCKVLSSDGSVSGSVNQSLSTGYSYSDLMFTVTYQGVRDGQQLFVYVYLSTSTALAQGCGVMAITLT